MPTLVERQRHYVELAAAMPAQPTAPVWCINANFLACLAAGDTARGNAFIREKGERAAALSIDCSDFLLNLFFRAQFLFPDRVTPENRELIRRAALGMRYYGGFRRDYPMYYSSENHHMNWAVAEYLAAQIYPGTTFTFDGRSSEAHRDRGRFLIVNWLDQRARWGYSEWNSSPYLGINLISLLNLVDFAAEPDIRALATAATTRLLTDVAADSLAGGVWATQARTYHGNLFSAGNQPIATALMILLGVGDLAELSLPTVNGVGDTVATTSYRPPAWLETLAHAGDTVMVNQERHRLENDFFYSARSSFWRPPLELTNEEARQGFSPDSLSDVPIRTERCRDYLVSAAMITGSREIKHVHGQGIIWMGCLAGRLPVFTTHPPRPADPRSESQYWAGAASTPRCYLKDGVLAAVYNGGTAGQDFTHAWFPTREFAAWKNTGAWYFGHRSDAYVALFPPVGAALTTDGKWAGSEIKAPGRSGAWVAVFSNARSDGDFTAFQTRCQKEIRPVFHPDTATLELQTGTQPLRITHADGVYIDGELFSASARPQIDNPFIRSDYGAAVSHIIAPGAAETTLDFSAARRIAATWERRD